MGHLSEEEPASYLYINIMKKDKPQCAMHKNKLP